LIVRALDELAYAVFLCGLIVGFFSFGAVTERGKAVLAICLLGFAGLVAARVLFTIAIHRRPLRLVRPPFLFALCLVGFLGWGAVQLLPLSEGMLQSLSPKSLEFQQLFTPIDWQQGPLSLDPQATRRALFWLTTLVVFGLALAQHCLSQRRRDRVIATLLAFWVICIMYGLLELAGLVGYSKGSRHLTGPLINRNHFATFMVLAAPLAAGWLLSQITRWQREPQRRAGEVPRDIWQLMNSGFALKALLPVLFMGACVLTLSRSGAAGCAVAMLLWLSLSLKGTGPRRIAIAVTAIVALTFIVLTATGWETLRERFTDLEEEFDPDHPYSRGQIWRDTWLIAADFPITGSGLGSYYGVFMPYSSADTRRLPIHAHSEWLQVLTETGLVGLILFTCAAGLFFFYLINAWRRDATGTNRPLIAGLLAGLFGLALQSLGEFPLRIPLVAVAVTACVGIAISLLPHITMRD
jgi:O-antigen ligase